MNVYTAGYYATYNYGAYDEIHLVIIANTKEEALGLALEHVDNTVAKHWTIEELPIEAGAHYITSYSR